ncbi:MAG TPA: serine/threonine-protein kinase [Vicinamibacteria bacterium]|nr:serine/threonine-protein kinase [Vicinamibacteria bacterium]
MKEAIPRTLGRYELQAELGRGMMGVVYRAVDPELDRTVALKTVRLAWAISEVDREVFEKRFLNEARVAGGLSHPGIVVVHDVGRDAATGTLFIALEFLEGRTLAELTAHDQPLDWREALRLASKVAEALHHAHEKGIVHRDVKPANIMVLPTGEPKIMDFGIAKLPTAQLTAAGEFFGTPSYMSPEQAGAGVIDGRSDLFSLGAVLYLLLTGRRAFDAASVTAILGRVAAADPVAPTRVVPGLPPAVDYLLARALAKKAADRFPNGRAFAEDMNDVLADREPRHRADWKPPPAVEGTFAADLIPLPSETEDLRGPRVKAPTLEGRARTLRNDADRRPLALGAAAVVALGALFLYARHVAPSSAPAADPPATDAREPIADSTPVPQPAQRSGLDRLLPRLFHKPAKVGLRFEHSLKDGTLRVYVDDTLVAERDLQAQVTKKIIIYKKRREVIEETLSVDPGERVVKLQVASGNDVYTSRIKGRFEEGESRRLLANLGGLGGGILGRDLEMSWAAAPTAASE